MAKKSSLGNSPEAKIPCADQLVQAGDNMVHLWYMCMNTSPGELLYGMSPRHLLLACALSLSVPYPLLLNNSLTYVCSVESGESL